MAFTSFRFDFEEKIEVLYCYEIHAEEAARSKGLGKLLMQVLLLIAGRNKMQKVMLTVFKGSSTGASLCMVAYSILITENTSAVRFFTETMKCV